MVDKVAIFYPENIRDWRKWLKKYHCTEKAVWLVFKTKKSGSKTITWSEAVDVALCYGWIDSKKIKIDENSSHQFFSQRKPKSTWSKINKEKVTKLLADGLMTAAGMAIIEKAKANGSWTVLDQVEALIIPADLEKALQAKKGAKDHLLSWSKSARKAMLQWIMLARRPETRMKRINEITEHAAQGVKPKQF